MELLLNIVSGTIAIVIGHKSASPKPAQAKEHQGSAAKSGVAECAFVSFLVIRRLCALQYSRGGEVAHEHTIPYLRHLKQIDHLNIVRIGGALKPCVRCSPVFAGVYTFSFSHEGGDS
jgi:hypothetical protein